MPSDNLKQAEALNRSFEALISYDQGSSRAALLPIDEAVAASLEDAVAKKSLEQRLVLALKQPGSAAAREYVCSKLTLIGSESTVPALAVLLTAPKTATAARTALEVIPGRQATKALRDSLQETGGLQKIGVINSLGARRDAESVRALTRLLQDADAGIASAAAAALGDIATSRATRVLRAFLPRASEAVRGRIADAMLNCAERLRAAGKLTEAGALYHALVSTDLSKHIRQAADRGLELLSGSK